VDQYNQLIKNPNLTVLTFDEKKTEYAPMDKKEKKWKNLVRRKHGSNLRHSVLKLHRFATASTDLSL